MARTRLRAPASDPWDSHRSKSVGYAQTLRRVGLEGRLRAARLQGPSPSRPPLSSQVDVDVYRSLASKRSEPLPGNTSFFQEHLAKWRELCSAADWLEAAAALHPLCQSMAQLLHHRGQVFAILTSRMKLSAGAHMRDCPAHPPARPPGFGAWSRPVRGAVGRQGEHLPGGPLAALWRPGKLPLLSLQNPTADAPPPAACSAVPRAPAGAGWHAGSGPAGRLPPPH